MGLFEVIPAIDLRNSRCVQLRQGKKEEQIFSSDEDPVEIAMNWIQLGARRLHIIDLDGAFQEEKTNFNVIKAIAESKRVRRNAKIQVGGGIRSYESAVKLLEVGAGEGVERVIFGTVALKLPQLIEKVVHTFSPERVMVALDVRRGKVAIDGWRTVTGVDAKDAAKRAERMGAGSLLFTNIDVEGLMKGIEWKIIEDFMSSVNVPVIVAGGVSCKEDIEMIKDAGARGVVLGSALYTGKIHFKQMIELFQD
jgi:phosphoribosylformimino-5-aminoimidazole carboxamide ribotide isomerase